MPHLHIELRFVASRPHNFMGSHNPVARQLARGSIHLDEFSITTLGGKLSGATRGTNDKDRLTSSVNSEQHIFCHTATADPLRYDCHTLPNVGRNRPKERAAWRQSS